MNQLSATIENAIKTQNLEVFVRENLQGSNMSIRGVAALCGVQDTSIIRGAAFKSEKLGQRLKQHGFEGAALVEFGFPPAAVWLTLEYFAYDSKAEAPYAKTIARTFGAFGVKHFMELGALAKGKTLGGHKQLSLAGQPLQAQLPMAMKANDLKSYVQANLVDDTRLTAESLAHLCGITVKELNRYQRGKQSFSADETWKVINHYVFNCSTIRPYRAESAYYRFARMGVTESLTRQEFETSYGYLRHTNVDQVLAELGHDPDIEILSSDAIYALVRAAQKDELRLHRDPEKALHRWAELGVKDSFTVTL